MKKWFAIIFMLFYLVPAMAATGNDGEKSDFKRHEISLSGAFLQGMYVWGYDFAQQEYTSVENGSQISFSGLYEDSAAVYNKETVTGSWGLSYTYNFTRLIGAFASFSYEGYRDQYYSAIDDSTLSSFYAHKCSMLVGVRISWLNRRTTRVYSAAGIGASLNKGRIKDKATGEKIAKSSPDYDIIGQVAPIGISIGTNTNWFGFAELGVGSVYVGARVGVGHSF